MKNHENDWRQVEADIFWREIVSADNVLQIYRDEKTLLDTLTGFVGGGIKEDDCIIVIATRKHLDELEERLSSYGIVVNALKSENIYVPIVAEEALSQFMIDGWPDEYRFAQTISAIVERSHQKKRNIRAFSEMVALLWMQGQKSATVLLGQFWNDFCEKSSILLFCAYPQLRLTEEELLSLRHFRDSHLILINGVETTVKKVFYQEMPVR